MTQRARPSALHPGTLTILGLLAMGLASPASAQDLGTIFGGTGTTGGSTLTGQSMTLIALVTVLSLAPGLAVMVTCFPFIVTVLSILRQAIGLQQSPPNILIVSLSLFLTWFIMEPVFNQAWSTAGQPLLEGSIDVATAIKTGSEPFHVFMAARVDPETIQSLASLRPETTSITTGADAPFSLLVPAFMLSEVTRAFEIGFLVFLPFLIIDLVVSALLMSMGMMMVPPAIVSLPFKLAFFVVANGWSLVSGALVRSYF
ncbi:MAG: flagellar type III secretion system pore protein FliP [Albidovulum sp.]